ncbi:ParB N-terminal domain-containing protein [Streptomyces sp. For3]|uniref:ParB/RepB/Spo0J family partition protein n=1 Tax=Streptomyces TaxID=1883 RepID=UPI0013E94BCD|nr:MULTISPECIES: ParB/RepB/Spo0J family partition protein [Streptomyces]MBL1290059.1 ParB N-terminal domain-containing protein [Streptomyces silvae]
MEMVTERADSDYLIKLQSLTHALPIEQVPVNQLRTGFSPRVDGEDAEHIQILAENADDLPPILVHRASMTVIDGAHRLRVAELLGTDHIAVRFFDGDQADALLLAVAANVIHGRPLSAADRSAAAVRIFAAHPRWSDRAVAAVAGLSPKKIARLRKDLVLPQSDSRVGRDGRVRPIDSARRRERAGELLRSNPGSSLRQIAAEVGLAPATVADVRDRIRRGESPVPSGARGRAVRPAEASHPTRQPGARSAGDPVPGGRAPADEASLRTALEDVRKITGMLARDPSLRHNMSGRSLLRLLDVCTLITLDRQKITETVPAHCKESVAQLARGYAGMWRWLAEDLVRQVEEMRDLGDDEALSA